jgi:hypothetical protein
MAGRCSPGARSAIGAALAAIVLTAACNSLFGIHQGNPRPICVGADAADPLIDDMEDGDGFICEAEGRHGHWYTYSDGTSTDLTPAVDFEPSRIPGGRGTSLYAAHLTGSGFTDWGVGMGFNLNLQDLARGSIDASTISGIRFWIKTATPVRVTFPTYLTAPPEIGGDCVDPNCNDDFGFDITAPIADWTEIEVPFSALQQQGGNAIWDPRNLIAIEFRIPPGAPFDVWVDDIYFRRCGGGTCLPTCTDPAWPDACSVSNGIPARCSPAGSTCVVGCNQSNTVAAPADGLITAFTAPDAGVQSWVPTGQAAAAPTFTTDGALRILVDAPVLSTVQVLVVDAPFPECVDASAFTGVQFSISGSLSGCTLLQATQDSAHLQYDGSATSSPGTFGTGAIGAHPNSTALTADQITPDPQIVTVPFAAATEGFPATPTDRSQLTYLGWAFHVDPYTAGGPTACQGDLTISGLKFY